MSNVLIDDTELSDEELLKLLLEEVHSGGFDGYLSYNSQYFERTLKIAENRRMTLLSKQLKRIKSMFPYNTVPNNAIDIIEENNLNFDDEDEMFYSSVCFEFHEVK